MTRTVAAFTVAGLLSAVSAFASPITVVNYSFEDPAGELPNACAGAGCSSTNGGVTPTGWTDTDGDDFGRFQPGAPGNTIYFDALSDGPTNAWANDVGVLYQTVAPTVVEGVTYTLLVDLGNRKDAGFTAAAELVIGATAYAATGVAPAEGAWSTYSVSYTGLAADVGQPIRINLRSLGGTFNQANFDNVRLDAVPEPASLVLLGTGLVGAGIRRYRARRS